MSVSDGDSIPPPRANPDLIGHAAAEARLKSAFAQGRLAHAWLITGPRGIGKATLAYRFARYVLARRAGLTPRALNDAPSLFGAPEPAEEAGEGGLHLDPKHPVFRRVAGGGHADLFTAEPGFDEKKGVRRAEIIVDDVRGIGHFLSLTPAEGGWRVVVVDSADEMNRNAANAILKALEEPPAKALLLLVSHNPGALLATIRSRCQRLALKPLKEADAVRVLGPLLPALAEPEIVELVRLAEGSPGRALELADEDGLALQRELDELLSKLPDLDGVALQRFGDRVGRSGAEAAFRIASEILRRWLARFSSADPGRWLDAQARIAGLLGRVEGLNLDRKAAMMDAFFQLRRAAGG
ncbi:MAG: DNA polymerase III subunit delta' [Rhodospirillales bacterium]|nr:DNA polymerase III subunit delta' [Rhodospirillales bacterium]MSP81231.1 DNA polymerase III subunit delta' [Rhodospirillales bacterium]